MVLFEDEASFYRQPSQAWLWSWYGRRQPKMRYSHRANTVMRVVGIMNGATADVHTWDFAHVTAIHLAECFSKLGSMYPQAERIYLVMDNWPVHMHPKVQKAIAGDPRIRMLFLPTYAPWLNNIEKLWRWVKQRVTHAHPWCDDFRLFRQQILAEFQTLSPGSIELKRHCGLVKLFG